MPNTQDARRTANQVGDSRWLELLARVGFIGYGIVHLLVAWLALQIAFGRSAADGDQSGAMRTLAAQPLGGVLLIAIAVGLTAMAIWQAIEAAVGHRAEQGRDRVLERVISAGRTAVYLSFAWTAVQVFRNAGSDTADQQQALSERVMSAPGGRWLVGVAGLVLVGIGAGMIFNGATRRFEKQLKTGAMSARVRQVTCRLGMVGYVAKGIAYGTAGVLVVVAAVQYDPERARGLDAALRALREQAYGTILLTLVAAGFAAFGIYCFAQSRYRKV
ncbi:DUF1206 domain-containing protein [Solwaraspora sp. WMMD406]|uniref:DUF1206 domain-containing protein n=1 Tax=Solwaraspora sp. WMMD406 TaxID=3016095 RepID=UPI0024168A4C|nr:DUF1206 domain-containing protein [Solwaraspora sp. WMMD406]MDG4766586.1 DUF1206 domain-containing protein [Solwaraspora sp. WMMD406]